MHSVANELPNIARPPNSYPLPNEGFLTPQLPKKAQIEIFKQNKGIGIIAFQKAKLSTTYKLVYCPNPKI